LLERGVRRAPLVERRRSLVLELGGARPEPLAVIGLHHQPHLPLHLVGCDERLIVPVHRDPDADFVDEEHLVHPLLRVEGPAHEGHPRGDGLQRRVPPAVAHERAHRAVAQHLHLRRPRRHHEPAPRGPVQEPLREQRAQVRLGPRRERLGRVRVRGAPHHPQEAVAAPLQPQRRLPQLVRRERAHAPEAEEHHAPLRPGVEPREARVPLRLRPSISFASDASSSLGFLEPAGDEGADAGARGAGLERLERVDEDAPGVGEAPEVADEGPVGVGVAVRQHLGHVAGGDGPHAREVDGGSAEVLEAGGAGGVVGEVEEHGEVGGAGGEEEVGGEGELGGDVEGVGAEEVEDEGAGGRGEGADEGEERGVVEAEHVEHPGEGVAARGGRCVGDAGEEVEGDRGG
ncbi:hypothetical protein ACMD2_10302, partial [Ananas comosus]